MTIGRLRDIDRSDDAACGDASRPKHIVHYDLEAFVWVTFYSILMYTMKNPGVVDDPSNQQALNRKRVIKRLSLLFKHFKLDEVLQAKTSFAFDGVDDLEFIEDVNLRNVAVGVWELLYDQNTRRGDPALMTHDSLCKVFVDAGA